MASLSWLADQGWFVRASSLKLSLPTQPSPGNPAGTPKIWKENLDFQSLTVASLVHNENDFERLSRSSTHNYPRRATLHPLSQKSSSIHALIKTTTCAILAGEGSDSSLTLAISLTSAVMFATMGIDMCTCVEAG